MGEVYRAHDARLGRDVALKVLPASFDGAPNPGIGSSQPREERLARFEREARAIASLSHPNILSVYEFGAHDGQPFVVMELLEGQTLRDRLADGALPARKAIAIATDVARGLAAAHEKQLVHRDLKPENIFLTSDGGTKILDFGLAKTAELPAFHGQPPHAAAETRAALTNEGTILGTVGYMAPEQVRGQPADARTDLFAWGAVVYEMLTGGRAFQRETAAETMTAILREEPADLAARPDVPPALARIVQHALEKNPGERFQTARDVVFALTSLSGSDASGARAPATGATEAPASAVTAIPSRTTARIIAVAAMLVVLAGTAGWYLGRSGSSGGVSAGRWDQFTQLTDSAGEETTPRISPDGTSFVYASRASGSWDVYVQRVGGRKPVLVAGDPARDELWPAFSPDGALIAFSEADPDGGVFITGATGESERRLTDFGSNAAWSPDGKSLVFSTESVANPYSRLGVSSLWVVDAAGGAPRQIQKELDAIQPAWSPSGRRIAFWAVIGGQRDIVTVAADGSDRRAVTDDAALDWAPAWSPDGRFLYFASDRGGSMGLWRIAVDQTTGQPSSDPESVTAGVEAAMDLPSFSADGRALLFRARIQAINPAAIPFDPVTLRAGEARLLLSRTGILSPFSVSPAGDWLALHNIGERQEDLFVMRTDGTDLRRLTDDAARDRAPRWSPTGKLLTFYSNRGGKYSAWSIRPDGSGLAVLARSESTELQYVAISPADGRLVIADGNGGGFFAGPAQPVTEDRLERMRRLDMPGGIFSPISWSPDGRFVSGNVIAKSGTPVGVAVYDSNTHQPRVLTPDRGIWCPVFLPDSNRLLYFTTRNELVVVDIPTGARRVLPLTLPFPVADESTAIAPDGRTIYVGAEQIEANIWKVEVRHF